MIKKDVARGAAGAAIPNRTAGIVDEGPGVNGAGPARTRTGTGVFVAPAAREVCLPDEQHQD